MPVDRTTTQILGKVVVERHFDASGNEVGFYVWHPQSKPSPEQVEKVAQARTEQVNEMLAEREFQSIIGGV